VTEAWAMRLRLRGEVEVAAHSPRHYFISNPYILVSSQFISILSPIGTWRELLLPSPGTELRFSIFSRINGEVTMQTMVTVEIRTDLRTLQTDIQHINVFN
jgi:hypothetical protein